MSDFDLYPDELNDVFCPHCEALYDKEELEIETDKQYAEYMRIDKMINKDLKGTLTCQECGKKFYFEAVVEYRYCSKKA